MVFQLPDFDDHEVVAFFRDAASGLNAVIAIHDTTLGPAFGGCRLWTYASDSEALTDALRLSRGMSYKNALAGLPFGGGKGVIMRDPRRPPGPALFRAFGRAIESLGGRYLTAEDVGVGVDDLREVAKSTAYVGGLPRPGGVGGDPSPHTAHGVMLGLAAALGRKRRSDQMAGIHVAVQGVGNVGFRLCRLLHERGCRLTVADIDPANVERARKAFGAAVAEPDAILFVEADVLAPCALGAVFDDATVGRVRAPVVAGAANNQLARDRHGQALHERGILFAPDYVINAGGVIAVSREYLGETRAEAIAAHIGRIPATLDEVFRRSEASGRPPNEIADRMAVERLGHAASPRRAA